MSPLVEGVQERFAPGEMSPRWVQLAVGRARVELGERLRLVVSEARAGQLTLAQIDDGTARPRERYLWRPPLIVEARLRFSHPAGRLLGTAGFGLWNNPAPLWSARMEESPRWLWFCYASGQGEGLQAAVATPGLSSLWRPSARERQAPVRAALDEWHSYRLAWLASRALCQVDGRTVLETTPAPAPPLALVAWMGNDRLGGAGSEHLAIVEPQWMEIEAITLA